MEKYFEKLDSLGEGAYGKVYKARCLQNIRDTLVIPDVNTIRNETTLDGIDLTNCLGDSLESYKELCSGRASNSSFLDRIKLRAPIYKGQIVAIKQIRSDKLKKQSDYKKMVLELKITLLLNDPNIIKVYGGFLHISDSWFSDEDKGFYIVMELFEASDCRVIQQHSGQYVDPFPSDLQHYVRFLRNSRTRDDDDTEKEKIIFYQIAKAVKAIHDKGILHLDLKPQNILVRDMYDESGDAKYPFLKVTDFGLSLLESTAAEYKGFRGTPTYLPLKRNQLNKTRYVPNKKFIKEVEINKKKKTFLDFTKNIDIYALFVIFVKCHTGRFIVDDRRRETYGFNCENFLSRNISDPQLQDLLTQMSNGEIDIDGVRAHPFFSGISGIFETALNEHKTFLKGQIEKTWKEVGVSKNVNTLVADFNNNINILHKQVKNKYSKNAKQKNFSNKTLKRLIYAGIFGLGETEGWFSKKTRKSLKPGVMKTKKTELIAYISDCSSRELTQLFTTEVHGSEEYRDKTYYQMMCSGLKHSEPNVQAAAFEILSIEKIAKVAFMHYKQSSASVKILTKLENKQTPKNTMISETDTFKNLKSNNSSIAIIPSDTFAGGKKPVKKTKKPVKKTKKPVKKIVSGKKRTIYTGIRGGKYYLKTKNGKKYKVYVNS